MGLLLCVYCLSRELVGGMAPPTSSAITNYDSMGDEFHAMPESMTARHMGLLQWVYCLSGLLVGGTNPPLAMQSRTATIS